MKCDEIRERMLDVAASLSEASAEESQHLASCTACAEQLKSIRSTMSLLDEWQTPEPSPYFDVRLQALYEQDHQLVQRSGRRQPVAVLRGRLARLHLTSGRGASV